MAKRIDWDSSRRSRRVYENGHIKAWWDGWKKEAKDPYHPGRHPNPWQLDPDLLYEIEFSGTLQNLKKKDLLGAATTLFPGLDENLWVSKIRVRCKKMPLAIKALLFSGLEKAKNKGSLSKVARLRSIDRKLALLTWLAFVQYDKETGVFVYSLQLKKNLSKWLQKAFPGTNGAGA